MKPFGKLVSFEEASRIMLDSVPPPCVETVPISGLRGRVLASDITAMRDVPGFRRAAMDGYAVAAQDTYGASGEKPAALSMGGKIFAGSVADAVVDRGCCIQIATGAPMPSGADAVVMVEETSVYDDIVMVRKPVYPGANVSLADSDIAQGSKVLSAGSVLGPGGIGVLASLGMDSADVYSKPVVDIFPTGEEIVSPGGELGPGQVYDINTYTLASLVESCGGISRTHPISMDSGDALRGIIGGSDGSLLVFSGGSSVGERDLLAGVVADIGELLFHGIALKPGKPTLFGRVDEKFILGMPGYPTSCLVNGYVLLAPLVHKLARIPHVVHTVQGVLSQRVVSTIGRHHLMMVRLEGGSVIPVFKESGAITGMSSAHGCIEVPADVECVEAGSTVSVRLF